MSGGGGGGQTTQIQKSDPWVGAQPFLLDAYQQAKAAAARTPTSAFSGNFVNPANTLQQQAVNQAALRANTLSDGQNVLDVANESLSGRMLDSNPYLQQAIDATVRPAVQRATDEILPSITTSAGAQGAFGGTRQAFLEALVARDVARQVADTAAQMWNNNYNRERMIQTQIAPQMLMAGNTLQMAPSQALLEAGNEQYRLDDLIRMNQQMQFEDEINRHWRAVNPYIAALSGLGMPGGQSVTTAQGAPGLSRGSAAGAGALSGAALGTAIYPGLGTLIGAGIGGLAGYFGAR
jgi:hypothetical protein